MLFSAKACIRSGIISRVRRINLVFVLIGNMGNHLKTWFYIQFSVYII